MTRLFSAAMLSAALLGTLPLGMPTAAAEPCPDVEVVFARGTTEAPGVGPFGQAFVDSLTAQLPGENVRVYPVNYPASLDFATGIQGISDATTHVQQMVASCPETKLVLGGFSQGAAVMGFVTTDLIPDGVTASEVPPPMPEAVADHVVAVALFGKPSTRFMNAVGQPPVAIGPLYAPKTLDLCVPMDFVCSDSGGDFGAHGRYLTDGLVDQAATFAAARALGTDPTPAAVESEPPVVATEPGPAVVAVEPAPHLPDAQPAAPAVVETAAG